MSLKWTLIYILLGEKQIVRAPRLYRNNIQHNTELFQLADANEALIALKRDAIKGAGVLVI